MRCPSEVSTSPKMLAEDIEIDWNVARGMPSRKI